MNLWFGLLPLLALFAFCCKCQNVVISQTTVSALTGDSLTLTCTPPNNEEAHVFTWKKDRVVISESDSKFVLLSFDASMHSTLVFNPAVQSLSGIYTCVLDGDPSNSASANVTIDPGCLPAPFRGNTAVGESVEYRCADVYSEFNPNGIMSWQCTTDQSWDVNMEACMFSSENSSSLHLLAYCLEASDEQVSENSTSIGNELVTSLNIYVNWQVAYIGRGPKYGQTLLVLALGISESNVHSQLDNLRILVQAGGFTLGGYQAEPYERDSAVWNGYVLFQSASSCNCPVRWSTAVATWTQSTVRAVQLCFGPSYITAPCICQDQNSNCQCSASFVQRDQSVCFLDTDGDGITELSDECQDCCPSEFKGGIEWPVTPQGMYSETTCINIFRYYHPDRFYLSGITKRSCGTDGVWGEVDYSKCYNSYSSEMIGVIIIAEVSSTSNVNSAVLEDQFEDFFQNYSTNGTLELNVFADPKFLQNNDSEVVLILGYWSDDQDTSILSVFQDYGSPPGAYTFAAAPLVLGFASQNQSVFQCDIQDGALQTTRFIAGNPNSCTCPLHLQQCQCLPECNMQFDSSTNTTFCECKTSSSTVIDSCSVEDGGNSTCPGEFYHPSFWVSHSERLIETPACHVLQQICHFGGYLRVPCGGDGVWGEPDISNCHGRWLPQCRIKISDGSYAISQSLPVRQGARIDLSSGTYRIYENALQLADRIDCYVTMTYPSEITAIVEMMVNILHVAQHTNYFVNTNGFGESGVEKRINWLFTITLRASHLSNYMNFVLIQWKEWAKYYNPLGPLVYFNTFEQLCVEIARVLPLDPSATTSAAVPGQGSVNISAWYYDTTNFTGYRYSGYTSGNTIGTGVFLEYLPSSFRGVRQFSSSLVNASIELDTLAKELPVVVAFHQRLHWDTPYNLTSQGSWAIHNDTILVHVGQECLNSAFTANVLFNIDPTFVVKCAVLSPDGGWEDQGVATISTEDGVTCVSSQCGWHTVLYKYPLTVDPQAIVLTEPGSGLTVDCYANGTYYHSSEVIWRFDGAKLNSISRLQGHYHTSVREHLTLQETAYSLTIDPGYVLSGVYSCEYHNYSFSTASARVENTAEHTYSLSLVAHPSAAVPTEGELYLNCTVRSSANTSTLHVVWKHNEFPVSNTSDAYNMTSEGDTHLLTVVRAQTSLSGVYSCQLHHYNVEVALEALNVTVQPGCLSQLLFPPSAVGVHQEVPCSTIHPSLSGSTKWSCEQDLTVSGSLDCFFAENTNKSVAIVTYTLKGEKRYIMRDQQSIENDINEQIHTIFGGSVPSYIIEIRSAGYRSVEFSLSLELDTVSSGDFVHLASSTAAGFSPGGYLATPKNVGAPIITPNESCSCPSLYRNIQAALSIGGPQLFACRAPSYVKTLCSCSPPNFYQVDSCSCSGVFTTVSTDELGFERCELDTDGDGIPDSIDPCIGCCTEDVSEGILWDRTAHGLDSRQPCSLLHLSFNQGTYATRKCSSKGSWLSVDVSGCSFKENAELSVVVIVVSVLASQADVKSNVSVFKTQLVAEFFSSYNVSDVSVSMYTAGKQEGVTVVTCSLGLPGEQVDSLVDRYSQSSEGKRRKRNFQFPQQPQVYGFIPANECLCQDPSVNSVSSGLTNVCKGASISPCQCDASGCQCLTPYINVSAANGEELKCSLDTDGDKIPDHLDSYPFVFNSSSLEPQDGCQGGSAHCPAESTSSPPLLWYKVGSCVRAVLRCSTDSNTVVGDAYRFCNSSGQWEDPDISQCQSAAVREATFLLDSVVSSVAGATVVLGGGRLLLEDGETVDSLNSISESLVNISSESSPEQQLLPGDLSATVNLLTSFATVSEQTNLLSVDAFNVVNLFKVTSNLLNEQNNKTWRSININSSSSVGNGLLNATERLSFSLAANLNMSSQQPRVIQLDNLVVNVQLVAPGASSGEDIVLARPSRNSSVAIPSSLIAGQQRNGSGDAGEGTEVVVVFVDRLSDYLPRRLDNQLSLDSNVLLSDSIVSVQVGSFSGQLGANSTIDLSFKVKKNSNSTCVFWNYSSNNSSSGGWSTEGVNTSAGANGSVLCRTSHLTNFAILVSPYQAEPPELAAFLSWISYIGCGISFVCLLATIAFLLYLRKELFAKLNQFVHLNLCIALACGLFIFMVGSQTAKEVPELCKIVAFLLHYFFLASFFWMLCEAVVMFNLLVRVFFANKRKWILLYLPLGWGTPLPIAVISAAVRHEQYIIKTPSGEPLACWLSWDYGTIAAFIGPMCLVLLVNAVLVVIIMRSLFKFYRGFGAEYSIQNEDTKAKELVKKLMKAFLVILPLMGFTWLVGLLAVNSATVGFSIAFVVLNSLQGAAIFVLYVLRHDKVRPKLVALFTRAKRIRPALPFRKRSLATMPTTESMEHLAPGTPTTTRAAFSFGTTSKLATVSVSHSGTLVKETSLAANEEEMQEEVVVFANAQAQDEDLEPRRVSTYSFTLREDTVVSSASTHVEPSD